MVFPFTLSCHPILYTPKLSCQINGGDTHIVVSKYKNPYQQLEDLVTSYLDNFPEHQDKEPEFIWQQVANIENEAFNNFVAKYAITEIAVLAGVLAYAGYLAE